MQKLEAYRWYNRAAGGGDEAAKEGLMEAVQRLDAERLRSLERDEDR